MRHSEQAEGRADGSASGITLLELMVAIVVSSIVIIGLARLFSTTVDHYSMQTQLSELHENTQYAVKYLSDAIMQVGADLPDSGIAIFEQPYAGADSVAVLVNPRGAAHYVERTTTGVKVLAVDDASAFIDRYGRELKILRKPYVRWDAVEEYSFDIAYTSDGAFSGGVDTINDSIAVSKAMDLERGDAIFAYLIESYYLDSMKLYHDDNVVAENIDSMAITFYDSTGTTATTEWDDARSAEVCVRGRTSSPIRGYTDPNEGDAYKRLTLRMKFRLRNKA